MENKIIKEIKTASDKINNFYPLRKFLDTTEKLDRA